MTALLARLLGRLPIGWLQLAHNPGRLAAALGGVAFADILILMQLGFLGALVESVRQPWTQMDAELVIQSADANTLSDGSPLPRARLFAALADPAVAEAVALMHGRLDWKLPGGEVRTLDVFGVDPAARAFRTPGIEARRPWLALGDAALLDARIRNAPPAVVAAAAAGAYRFEAQGRALDVVGAFEIGGGFSSDGHMVVSDQTFLRLFPRRASAAPSLVLLRLAPGADPADAQARLVAALPGDVVVRTLAQAAEADQRFQTTQRPVGLIFGFGVGIGLLVGVVIVYQVLSTDVADHLREYATFKAMGFRRRFFLGVVFEEAAILAALGFLPGLAVALGLYAVVAQATGLPVAMPPERAAGVFLATLGMCALSGAVATRRLARADPAALF